MPDKEALFYKNLEKNKVQCTLCPHNCVISENKTGFCKVRLNSAGKLYAFTYAKPVSIAVDPIEKKPLFHFNPGEKILSIGTYGCNFACKHCQNYDIAREFDLNQIDRLETVAPETMIEICKKKQLNMIAYTYNEPTVYYEYMLETARLARKNNIQNVIVSNGYINKDPLKELYPLVDAANIDLKSFDNSFYTKISSSKLQPVLDNLRLIRKSFPHCHIELTTLVIPTLNDNLKMIDKMSKWIKDNLGVNTPLHLTRFFPMYKLNNLSPTPVKFLLDAEKTAKKHLKHVHLGNV